MKKELGKRKLLAFLNLEDLTNELIDKAFEKEGKDIGSTLGEKIIQQKEIFGKFIDLESILNVSGIGETRLNIMLEAAVEGKLDEFLPNEDVVPNLLVLPKVIRTIGSLFIGPTCTSIAERLEQSAAAVDTVVEFLPKIKRFANDLRNAATVIEKGKGQISLTSINELLKIPDINLILKQVPEEFHEDLKIYNQQVQRLDEALQQYESSQWLGQSQYKADDVLYWIIGPNATENFEPIKSLGCRIAEAALLEAGILLIGIAHQLEILMNPVFLLLNDPEEECTLGDIRDCSAIKTIFVPKGRDVDDAKDFKNALTFLKVFSVITPGKTLSPGGKSMIRKITKGLDKIKKAADKKLIGMNGYSVFVLLEYEECISRFFGKNYWGEKTKVVEVMPPNGKRHPIGDKGWKRTVIENLGKNITKTKKQFKEFSKLAEKQCPK